MRKIVYKIPQNGHGMTVEHYLKRLHNYSSRTIIKLKHYDEGIRRNGYHVRTIDLLQQGDSLEINFLDEKEHGVEHFIRSNKKVDITYEDKDIIVFNKPIDMPCHQSCGHAADTLANVFATHCDKLEMDLMYRPLNRLDRDTTGAVVVAKNRYAAASVTGNFDKVYRGILDGVPPKPFGKIDQPIGRANPDEIIRTVTMEGQHAITHYQVVADDGRYSLVDFRLETGRTHQIRVHMAHLGCPVLGDSTYGSKTNLISRQALHCYQVAFMQPVTGEALRIICPFPEDIQNALSELEMTKYI